jgi:hypothetical protein
MINNYDGALSSIIAILDSASDVETSVFPCIPQIVERCATTDQAAWDIVELDAIESLVRAMAANEDHATFQMASCRALAAVATSGRGVAALVERGGVKEVVATLTRDHQNLDVALAALEFINKMGGTPLMEDELDALIGDMVTSESVQGILYAIDAEPVEEDGLSNADHPPLAAAAMKALTFLGQNSFEARDAIMEGSAIDWAVYSLANEATQVDATVVENALHLLAMLAEDQETGEPDEEAVAIIIEKGAVDPVVMGLNNHHEHAGVQSAGNDVIRLIVSAEAVESMVGTLVKSHEALRQCKHLTEDDARSVEIPAMALAAFASWNSAAIIEGGGLKGLVGLLKWTITQRNMPRQEHVMSSCLVALKKLAAEGDEEAATTLYEWLSVEDGIKTMTKAIKHDPTYKLVAKSGIDLMESITVSPDSHDEVILHNAIEVATRALKNNASSIKLNTTVVDVFENLVADSVGAKAVCARGGIKALFEVLRQKAPRQDFTETIERACRQIVSACETSSSCAAELRKQHLLRDIMGILQDQPDPGLFEAGTAAIDAILNFETVQSAITDLKHLVDQMETGQVQKLTKVTAATGLAGYIATSARFADRIVDLRGPAALVKSLALVHDMPETTAGWLPCLTAGIEACGLLGGRIAAKEYAPAVPTILDYLKKLQSPACLTCIDRLAHDSENIPQILASGSIADIINIIKEKGGDTNIARPAFGALTTLAKERESADEIRSLLGADCALEWLKFNLSDSGKESAAVNALEFISALCADDIHGEALCKRLRDTGELHDVFAETFESARKPTPTLMTAALTLSGIAVTEREDLENFKVDTGRLRKLVEMFDTYGCAGNDATPLHGTGERYKALARSVIIQHNNLYRADLHAPCEAEGIVRLIEELIEEHPPLAGMVLGMEPDKLLEKALRHLDARFEDGDDDGVDNIDGFCADLDEICRCLAMEGALNHMNAQWTLATLTDSLTKLKALDTDAADSDAVSSLVADALFPLMSWGKSAETVIYEEITNKFSETKRTSLSFDELSGSFPEKMSTDDLMATFDEIKNEHGELNLTDAQHFVDAVSLPLAGVIQEFSGLFENGGETSPKLMSVVSTLTASNSSVLHELAQVGTVAEIAERYELLRVDAEDAERRIGAEGNAAVKCMNQVYASLAPLISSMRDTDDNATTIDLLNVCPKSVHFRTLTSIAEIPDGIPYIFDVAMGKVSDVHRPLQISAMEFLNLEMDTFIDSLTQLNSGVFPFIKMMNLAVKLYSSNDEGFDSTMERLLQHLETPGYPAELLAAEPHFMETLAQMINSGDEGQIIVACQLLTSFAGAIESSELKHLLLPMQQTKILHTLGMSIMPDSHNMYDNATLMNCVDCFNSVANVMVSDSVDEWDIMGLSVDTYHAMLPTINFFSHANGDEEAAIYEAGVDLLQKFEDKHGIEPEYDLVETLKESFNALQIATDELYECEIDDCGELLFVADDGEVMDGDPPEYGAMLDAAENMAEVAHMCSGGVKHVGKESMDVLVCCFVKHAEDVQAATSLAHTLNKLAENQDNLNQMADLGCIEGIIKALIANPGRTPLLRICIYLLEKFARTDVHKEKIGRLEGCKALVMCLDKHCEPDYVSGAAIASTTDDEEKSEEVQSKHGDLHDHDVMLIALTALLANVSYNSSSNVMRIIAEDGVGVVQTTMRAYGTKPLILEMLMTNLVNWMCVSKKIVLDVGSRCTADIVESVTNNINNASFLTNALHVIGNLTMVETNIITIVNCNTISMIVNIIRSDTYLTEKVVLRLAIQVLGNIATVSDVELTGTYTGESVAAVIFNQGGAHAVLSAGKKGVDDKEMVLCVLEALNHLCQDVTIASKLNDAGIVDMTIDVANAWNNDVEVIERVFELTYTICFAAECAHTFVSSGALDKRIALMDKLGPASPDSILVIGCANLAMLLKSRSRDERNQYGNAIHAANGVSVLARLCADHYESDEFILEAIETVSGISAISDLAHNVATVFMPSLRQIVLHYLSIGGSDALEVLDRCFKMMSLFAFDERNIETIVMNSGLPLVLRAVSKYPQEEMLMERAIKTIDFIAMGDKEYTKIVISKGGKAVIEKIMEVYADSDSIQSLGDRALAAFASLEIETVSLNHGLDDIM